jgi:hypothetical protein
MSLALLFIVISLSAQAQSVRRKSSAPEWKEFVSTKGGFSALMPGSPAEESSAEESPLVGQTQRRSFESIAESVMFIIAYEDTPGLANYSSEEADQFRLAFMRTYGQGLAEGLEGKIVKETDITLEGHPGKELLIKCSDGQFTARFGWIKWRFYHLVAGPAPFKEGADLVAKFLNSFKLLTK